MVERFDSARAARFPDLGHAELSLKQIWSILSRYKTIVVGIPIVVAAAALVTVLLLKDQWEVRVLIQIGQIGDLPVEPLERSAERLRQDSFDNAVLTSLNIPIDGASAKLFRRSKIVSQLPADLIELKVRGYSPTEAIKFIKAKVMALRRTHEAIAEPSISHFRQRLQQMEADLERLEKLRGQLQDTFNAQRGSVAAGVGVLGATMQQLTTQTLDLGTAVADLKHQLSANRTYSTSLLGDAQVSEQAVAPRRDLIVGLSVLAALFLGVTAALILNAARAGASNDT